MPTQDLLGAKQNMTNSQSIANDLAAGSYNIEGALKKALGEAYNANADIVKPLDEATSNYLTAPSAGREKFQNIFNPFTREKLVSQYTQNQAIPMLTLSNLLGSRQGSIADTIRAGTGAYQAQASAAQGKAALDRQTYQDLLKEYQDERQYQMELSKSNAGGLTPNQMLSNLRAFDPSDTRKMEAQKAQSALDAIKRITSANPNALSGASRLSSGAEGLWGGLTRTMANLTATPEQREVSRAMDTLRNILRLEFTGAAFSPTELSTYSRLTGADPFQTFIDPRSSQLAAQELQDYFSGIQRLGQNPYQGQLDQLMQSIYGGRPPIESFDR